MKVSIIHNLSGDRAEIVRVLQKAGWEKINSTQIANGKHVGATNLYLMDLIEMHIVEREYDFEQKRCIYGLCSNVRVGDD